MNQRLGNTVLFVIKNANVTLIKSSTYQSVNSKFLWQRKQKKVMEENAGWIACEKVARF